MPVAALLLLAPGAAPSPAAAAAAPSCAEGPQTRGTTTLGTPCADTIHVPAGVMTVRAGGGDDTIVPMPIAAAADCPQGCFLGVGGQTFEGGPGDDVVYGQRGNDKLSGGEGNDALFGGIGDDQLRGGPGSDLLAGGFGFDVLDGEAGDDLVHGDGTIDEILDSGGGTDTLSYATGVTPGFTRSTGIAGFPPASGERGVYVDLAAGTGDNGVAPAGGGADEVKVKAGSFERVIGTPFSDYVAGGEGAETIYGGGGADALLGGGGDDTLHGGADGDLLEGGPGTDSLDPGPGDAGTAIGIRNGSKVSAGFEAPGDPGPADLYLVGSGAGDDVTATYAPGSVSFQLASAATFDQTPPGCEMPVAGRLVCQLQTPLDALVLAGGGGNDTLRADGFPAAVSVVELGGEGQDTVLGGEASEDVLVDGPGDDLFLTDVLCEDDLVDGGADRDNSSWAKLTEPVAARLDTGIAGRPVGGEPSCSSGSPAHLQSIEDLEATSQADFLYGDGGNNQLLGRPGPDTYFAFDGEDSILANSGDQDLGIDCGAGSRDSALVDLPPVVDPTPVGCEFVNQSPPESFEPPDLTTPGATAPPPPAVQPPAPPVDRRPPTTRITRRPAKVLSASGPRRRVVFAFASNEVGASFRCRLDAGPLAPCRSPRAYTVRPGRHILRVVAIDAAGNRDPSPALFSFRVRRR